MATDTPEPTPNPDTVGYKTEFIVIECEGVELTPEVLALPRYGRPDPRRYLADDTSPPSPPDAPPPGGTSNPA
jgi:hypothetical protein